MPVVAPFVVAVIAACARPEPAPLDLDEALRAAWVALDADPDLRARADDVLAAVDTAPADGGLAPLSSAEVAHVRDTDPSAAAGVWIAHDLPCDPEEVLAAHVDADQGALHDVFDSYERTFDGDVGAFLAGDAEALGWDVTYAATIPLGGTYTALLRGEVRRIDGGFVSWSWLVEPATWDGEPRVFDHDYRVEVYVDHAGGARHVEGLWRHLVAGLADTDDDSTLKLLIDGLHDWDDEIAATCAGGSE